MESKVELIGTVEILGKEIKFYGSWENPLFLGKEVAEWVGYSKRSNGTYDVSRMLETVDEDEKLVRIAYVSGQARKMWFLTEKGVKQTLANSRKISAKETLKLVDDGYGYRNCPKQTQFEAMLKNAINIYLTSQHLPSNVKVEYKEKLFYRTEVTYGKYRVDFIFPSCNLIVEYDEQHHERQVNEDRIREYEIKKIVKGANFIRVKEGREFEGIIKIFAYLNHNV